VIIDQSRAFQFGHSLKDLGKKDTHMTKIDDPAPLMKLFETRWQAGSIVSLSVPNKNFYEFPLAGTDETS